jgi:molybdopterin-guanine dinucleotide biosynthesis protein A
VSQQRVAGLILAGGNSSRMIVNAEQTDKAWVCWRGKPLIQHAIEGLEKQVSFLMISSSPNAKNRLLYEGLGIKLIDDFESKLETESFTPNNQQGSTSKQGPLAGILAGLIHCQTNGSADWLQVVPCDAPNVPTTLVAQLLAGDRQSGSEESSLNIRMPIGADKREQPMFALLPIGVTSELQIYFNAGGRSLLAFAKGKISNEACVFFKESVRSNFANINSLADFEQLP